MKTTSVLKGMIVTLVAIFACNVMVSAKSPAKGSIQQAIKAQVSYPEFAIEKKLEGTVNVTFQVKDDGTINIVKINSFDELVTKHVTKQLEKVKVNPAIYDLSKNYQTTIEFKLL